jgi:nucleoside-diphosphate-sugar epimerase
MFNLQTVIVRPTSLYGPGEQARPSRPLVSALCRLVGAARRGERVNVQGQGARCDWLYVDDAAQLVSRLVSEARVASQVFNLSSGIARPFGEIVDLIAALTPLQLDAQAEKVIDGSPDRPATIANERLRSLLGWQPRSLGAAIREYLACIAEQSAENHKLDFGRQHGT